MFFDEAKHVEAGKPTQRDAHKKGDLVRFLPLPGQYICLLMLAWSSGGVTLLAKFCTENGIVYRLKSSHLHKAPPKYQLVSDDEAVQ